MIQNGMRFTKVKQPRSCAKEIVAFTFSSTGYDCSVTLENKKIVTANCYTTIYLTIIRSEKKKLFCTIPAHHTKLTTEFFRSGVMLHPPYSPDKALCNFLLFPTIKTKFTE